MTGFIGQSIGRYQIVERLGQGGMAVVYRGFDTRLERDVAIKVIRTGMVGPDVLDQMLKRFEREAKSLAKMKHRDIVNIHDYGEHEGSPYLVMEYLPGGTLKERAGKPYPYMGAARLLLPIANALDYAHKRGVLHRDVKPANILITEEGDPLLSDFGIAKILEREQTTQLTGTGAGIGTPQYMAPEQWRGQAVAQTDIYALGVVFYELVTGRKPYDADTPAAIFEKVLLDPLPRPKDYVPDLPDAVEKVLFKALAKKPEDRYISMAQFAKTLEQLLREAPGGQQTGVGGLETDETLLRPPQRSVQDDPVAGHPSHLSGMVQADYSKDSGGRGGVSPPLRRIPLWAWIAVGAGLLTVIAIIMFARANGRSPLRAAATKLTPTQASSPTQTATAAATQTPTETAPPIATLAPALTPTPVLGIGSTQVSAKDGMVQVYVPEGEFEMGAELYYDPIHTVYQDAFWIDQTEVTNAKYALCVAAGGCTVPHSMGSYGRASYYGSDDYVDYPVVYIDWYQAESYCDWAERRLPTEAEWEKAARGTDGRTYPWGNQPPNESLLNYDWNEKDTTSVGSYPEGASPYGALDMAGNVFEWVADWFAIDYYKISPFINPVGPPNGESRVLRGGSWSDNYDPDHGSDWFATYLRHNSGSSEEAWRVGFRCGAGE